MVAVGVIGMLSKSRGHILRVAAVTHVLFCLGSEDMYTDIPETISTAAVTAAINFVSVTCQQTAYIAGQGLLSEEIERYKSGKFPKVFFCCIDSLCN